jgi:hypothetical protein
MKRLCIEAISASITPSKKNSFSCEGLLWETENRKANRIPIHFEDDPLERHGIAGNGRGRRTDNRERRARRSEAGGPLTAELVASALNETSANSIG